MPLPNDLAWIETRFDPYNIVYLDPLVCQLALAMTWRTLYLAQDRSPTQQFVKELLDRLHVKQGEKLPATYLEPKGLGTRFKKDRRLQQDVTRFIVESLSGQHDQIPHFRNLRQFFAARNQLGQDRSTTGPLIALDTMFSARATLPEDMRLSLPTHYEPEPRSVECVLVDQHPNLLTLYDRRLPLSVDRRAFYEWTEDFTKILVMGWHPFVRTMGFYTTSPGGQPFIKVLAILVRPFRSVDEILLPETGMQATASLRVVMRNNLTAIQTKIASFATPSSATAPPAAATTIPPIAYPAPAAAPSGAPPTTAVSPSASQATPPTAPSAPSPAPAQSSAPAPTTSAVGSVVRGTTPATPAPPSTGSGNWINSPAPATPSPNTAVSEPAAPVTGPGLPVQAGTASATTSQPSPPSPGASTGAPPTTPSAAGATASTSPSTPSAAVSGTGPGRPAAGQPAHAQTRSSGPDLTFTEYRRYMYPIYVIQLICGLNGITANGLRRGARSTYMLLKEYLEQLQKLHDYKDRLSVQVLEMAPPDGIEALLEEPPRLDGQELAPYD